MTANNLLPAEPDANGPGRLWTADEVVQYPRAAAGRLNAFIVEAERRSAAPSAAAQQVALPEKEERQAFEAWYLRQYRSRLFCMNRWEGWQARASLSSPPSAAPAVVVVPMKPLDPRVSALRWLLNITTEFDRKDVRTRQAARLLDEFHDADGRTNRDLLEDLWRVVSGTDVPALSAAGQAVKLTTEKP